MKFNWQNKYQDELVLEGLNETYNIRWRLNEGRYAYQVQVVYERQSFFSPEFRDLEEAKQWAEEDYERRISERPPAKPDYDEGWSAMLELKGAVLEFEAFCENNPPSRGASEELTASEWVENTRFQAKKTNNLEYIRRALVRYMRATGSSRYHRREHNNCWHMVVKEFVPVPLEIKVGNLLHRVVGGEVIGDLLGPINLEDCDD